ncbi:MAG: hypothetical protein AB3N18_04585 [Allomuricauda sp.]
MEALKGQYEHDIEYATTLSSLLGNAEVPVYNNGALATLVVKMLSRLFNEPNEAEMRINNFMYEENFGKSTDMTISNLWEELTTIR